jgi:hypothetical protein
MPYSTLLRCAFASLLLVVPAAHGNGDQVDALALSQAWQDRVGETVTISGCMLTSATPDLVMCLATSERGRPPSIMVDPSGMEPQDLERAIRECSSYVGYPICGVLLEGEIAADSGELKIMNSSVTWNYPSLDS